MEEGLIMALPEQPIEWMDEWDELERFMVAPLFFINPWAWMDVVQGRTDISETVRNNLIWASIPTAVSIYNAVYHSGKYGRAPAMLQGLGRLISHTPPVVIPFVVATAAAYGYVATADVHGGVIATGNPSFGPGIYGSDPMGEFEEAVRGLFERLGF